MVVMVVPVCPLVLQEAPCPGRAAAVGVKTIELAVLEVLAVRAVVETVVVQPEFPQRVRQTLVAVAVVADTPVLFLRRAKTVVPAWLFLNYPKVTLQPLALV
jgi:hypothetical protein